MKQEDKDIFLAFSRVYSGTIHRGQKLFVLHPRYDPREVDLGNVLSNGEFPPERIRVHCWGFVHS